VRAAIAFFLHAASDAEIPVSPHFKIPPVRSGNGKPVVRRTKSTTKGKADGGQTPPAPLPADPSADLRTRYIDMLLKKVEEQDQMDGELLDRIETLLGYEAEPKE